MNTGPARRFLGFRVAGTAFALPLTEAREIIRAPDLLRIPLAPPSLRGLARRHGAALPVVSLRRALGRSEADEDLVDDTAERVLVVGHRGLPVGLAVDRVDGVLSVDPANIDRADIGPDALTPGAETDAEAGGLDTALLAGAIRGADGAVAALILAARTLIDREFANLARPAARPADAARPATATAAATVTAGTAGEAAGPRAALIVFDVAGQEFALPVERVERIVPLPTGVAAMPKARAHLLGIVALAGGMLPLIGLRALFGLDDAAAPARAARVVVAEVEGERAGLVVDGVREILRVAPDAVAPVPAILAREPEFADLAGIAHLDGGRRLVSVLSAGRLLNHTAALSTAFADNKQADNARKNGREDAAMPDDAANTAGAAAPHVIVCVGGAEYGLPVAAVREVLRRPDDLAPLPKAPDFVAGLVNLRGSALPVVSARRILRLPEGTAERPRIVVTTIGGDMRVGLLVDAMAGVVRIPAAAIEPAPALSAAQHRLIDRVAHLDGRMVLLLDVGALFDLEQLAQLLEPT